MDDLQRREQSAYDHFVDDMASANRATATKDGFIPSRNEELFAQLKQEAIDRYVAALDDIGVAAPRLLAQTREHGKGD